MRKNTVSVYNAWVKGEGNKHQKSIWTDGINIYSYNTRILEWIDPDTLHLNMDRYSRTTSCHQNGLLHLLNRGNIPYNVK